MAWYGTESQARFPSTPSFTHIDDTTTWLVFCSPVTMIKHKPFVLDSNEEQLHSLVMSLKKDSGYIVCPSLPYLRLLSLWCLEVRNYAGGGHCCSAPIMIMWIAWCGIVSLLLLQVYAQNGHACHITFRIWSSKRVQSPLLQGKESISWE